MTNRLPAVLLALAPLGCLPHSDVRPSELASVLSRADHVVVKESPSDDAEILFQSSDIEVLDSLRRALVVRRPRQWEDCPCIGTPALFLYSGEKRLLVVTNHHARLIRCDLWESDALIQDSEAWLDWFDAHGMPGPRQELEETRESNRRWADDYAKWIAALPPGLEPAWRTTVRGGPGNFDVDALRSAFARAIPDQNERIRAELKLLGSGAGPWSGYPGYEYVAATLLMDYPPDELVEAIEAGAMTTEQCEGAARLLSASFYFSKYPNGKEQIPLEIKNMLWHHVEQTSENELNLEWARESLLVE